MELITSSELHRMLSEEVDFQLIDVRESYEFEESNIGGANIPLGELLERKNELTQNSIIVMCCKSGKRSSAMAHTLERKFGMTNIKSLQGGLEKYTTEYA